jgi:hypothetical protein
MSDYKQFSAVISGAYRYELRRCWDPDLEVVLFVGLNPSTADGNTDDHTIERCRYYATRWGYGGLIMANLYALRTTHPKNLLRARSEITNSTVPTVVGHETDRYLLRCVNDAALVVACWGASKHPDASRVATVSELILARHWSRTIWCLGKTAGGHPRHPSRLGNDVELEIWRQADGLTAADVPPPVELHPLAPVEVTIPVSPHPFDRCECGHLRDYHRTASCLGSSFKRGGTGRQVGHTDSSVCPCQGFTSDGTRFVYSEDPKVRKAVKQGHADATYRPIGEL